MEPFFWSSYDAQIYRALNLLPEGNEGKFLDPNQFRSHFKDFYGRPIQDIIEALRRYGQEGYFKSEIILNAEYLEHGKALDQVTTALNQLRPEPIAPDKYRGLDELIYTKVLTGRPLNIAEASNLPDEAKNYLVFKLSGIDRRRLRSELAVYNDNEHIPPSRLVKKNMSSELTTYNAEVRVIQDDPFVRIIITPGGEYKIAKLQVGRAPYDFMHYLALPENRHINVTIDEVQKGVQSCAGRADLTELVRDCGFNKVLKKAFFSSINSTGIFFEPITEINLEQFNAVKKQAMKLGNKS